MRVVERNRGKAALKQMPGPARSRIDESGVLPVRLADCTGEPIRTGWNEYEMHMIGHQVICPGLHRGLAAAFGQKIAVERIIGGFKENRLAAIAALGDVMGKPRSNDAAEPHHAVIMWYSIYRCNG
jgi:hypothetical protein